MILVTVKFIIASLIYARAKGGYLLWNYALSKMEEVKATVWLYLEPVATFIGELALFLLIPAPLTILGSVCILVGALLTNLSKIN